MITITCDRCRKQIPSRDVTHSDSKVYSRFGPDDTRKGDSRWQVRIDLPKHICNSCFKTLEHAINDWVSEYKES